MAREGTTKVDIPFSLSVTKPNNSDASVATTTLTSTTTSNMSTLEAALKSLEAKLDAKQAAFEKVCVRQHNETKDTLLKLQEETRTIKQDADFLAADFERNNEDLSELIGKLDKRACVQLTRYVDYRFDHYASTTHKILEYMLQQDGVPQEVIDSMMHIDQAPFDVNADLYDEGQEFEYDEEYEEEYDDDAEFDDMYDDAKKEEEDFNDENKDPLRDDTEEENKKKSARIASSGGLISNGQKDDRPAESQMATDEQ